MAVGSKRGIGIGIVGFVFAMSGLIFLIAGNIPIGIVNVAMGMIFITIGIAAPRKATPPDESTGTHAPAEGASGRA